MRGPGHDTRFEARGLLGVLLIQWVVQELRICLKQNLCRIPQFRYHVCSEYRLLLPRLDALPGAVGDLALDFVKFLWVKTAEALPAEIVAE